MKGVAFTRDLDNALWSATSFVFQGQIRQALEKAATFDLKPTIVSANARLQEKLVELQTSPPNIEIKLQDSQVGLGAIVLTDRDIETVATFKGAASVNIPLAAAKGLQIKSAAGASVGR